MPARCQSAIPKASSATGGYGDPNRHGSGRPKAERGGANQHKAENVSWVSSKARWSHLQSNAKQPTIGKTVDDAMVAIERDNPRLKGVRTRDYVIDSPSFNDSDWDRKDDDVRWQPSGARWSAKGSPQGERGGVHQFGVPSKGNANFAWVQYFIHHPAPQSMDGFALSDGRMSSNQTGEGELLRARIESEVRIAEDSGHTMRFNGERFSGRNET